MKYIRWLGLVTLALLLNACSTDRGTGGAFDDRQATDIQRGALPPGSPSERPGMTPEDPRDPQFITRPQPLEAPPTTKP